MTDWSPRSKAEWAVLDEVRRHYYDTRTRGSKPDDPGWHPCRCGWEGYWSSYQPHVAEELIKKFPSLKVQEGQDVRHP